MKSSLSTILLALIAFIITLGSIQAADFTFTATGNVNFATLTNWLGGALPGTDDRILINADNDVTVTFSLSTANEYGDVILGAGASATKTQKLVLSSGFASRGTITVRKGGVLEIEDTGKISKGAITVEEGGKVVQKGTVLMNENITVQSGGTYTYEAGVMEAGNELVVQAGGTLAITGSAVNRQVLRAIVVSGNLMMSATDSVQFNKDITVKSKGKMTWDNSGMIQGSGTLRVEAGGSAVVNSATTIKMKAQNSGEFIMKNSKIFINETYTQASATAHTVIDGAEVIYTSASAWAFAAGNISASGTIRSENGFKFAGTFRTGVKAAASSRKRDSDETGKVYVYGDFELEEGAWLDVDAASSSDYDQINVFGKAIYNADTGVYMRGVDGFIPRVGDDYLIVKHASRDGTLTRFFSWGVFGVEYSFSQLQTRVRVTSSIAGSGSSISVSFAAVAFAALICILQFVAM